METNSITAAIQEASKRRTALPSPLTRELRESRVHAFTRTRDPDLRDAVILDHQGLVKSIAARFLGNGETLDDLVQVGNIGLINALDRYNPGQGTRFSTYATPTILGEIKRHFRDKTCGVKVPRWLQELHQAARRASQGLTQELGRSPSVCEVAQRLGASEEETLQALESGEAMNLLSLDMRLDQGRGTPDSSTLLDLVGRQDIALNDFEAFGDLRHAIGCLEARERLIISLRFFDEMSQAKIAEKMNVSQMHVSRLQQRALKRLRDLLAEDACRHTLRLQKK